MRLAAWGGLLPECGRCHQVSDAGKANRHNTEGSQYVYLADQPIGENRPDTDNAVYPLNDHSSYRK